MKIGFDPKKHEKTLKERRLDFAECEQVFAGPVYTVEDDRFDYGETRWVTYGLLRGRLIAVVWSNAASIATSSR